MAVLRRAKDLNAPEAVGGSIWVETEYVPTLEAAAESPRPSTGGSERDVPAPPSAGRTPELAAADSLQWNEKVLGGAIRRLFDEAGVKPQGSHTLHLLRGTFATNVLRSGGDLESLRALLGHADLRTTSLYLTATSESLRRAVSGLQLPG